MLIAVIEGANRICGKQQGFLGLPVRDETRKCNVTGGQVPTMTTAWVPTEQELQDLNNGAAIHVSIDGQVPSPMLLIVGPVPDQSGNG
jgi:hypothetical protein